MHDGVGTDQLGRVERERKAAAPDRNPSLELVAGQENAGAEEDREGAFAAIRLEQVEELGSAATRMGQEPCIRMGGAREDPPIDLPQEAGLSVHKPGCQL
jgi:hypothetical protein